MRGGLGLLLAPSLFALVFSAVGLLLCWYLYVNVKRLAAEARTQPVAKVFE